MAKIYNIEGNIDFYNELYMSLDTDDNLDNENLCLITNEPLTTNFVQLECKHKFNYIALYNDIKNHKQKFNSLEGSKSQLKINEIRCPYCRNRQNGLLNYYEELGLPQLHGVNYINPNRKNEPVNMCINHYSPCQYLTPNPQYDPSGNNPVETINEGNCKFLKCLNYSHYQISKYIENYTGEDLHVCYLHKKTLVKVHNMDIKNKKKEEDKKAKEEAKLKAKLKAKEVKNEAKLKAKEDKQNTKKKIKNPVENEIISSNIVIGTPTNTQCIEIVKSGPNKGKVCGCKIYNTPYCKRHVKKIETLNTEPNTDQTPEI
jgi:hypothetical protein